MVTEESLQSTLSSNSRPIKGPMERSALKASKQKTIEINYRKKLKKEDVEILGSFWLYLYHCSSRMFQRPTKWVYAHTIVINFKMHAYMHDFN